MEDFDIGKIMQMAGDFRSALDKITRKLEKEEIDVSIGGGMIKLSINGVGKVKELQIDETLFSKGDKEMLEDMLTAAFEVAIRRLKEAIEKTFSATLMESFPLFNLLDNFINNEDEDE